MVKTKKKEVQKPGLRPSQKAKAEKLRKKQEAKKATADLFSVNENDVQNVISATEQKTQPSLSAAAEKKTRAKATISITKGKKIVRKTTSATTAKKTTRTTVKEATAEGQSQGKENVAEPIATITVKNAVENADFEDNSIPVVFITDDDYVVPTSVAVTSLICNKKPTTKYSIFILTNELNEENMQRFQSLNSDDIKLEIITVSTTELDGLHKYEANTVCQATPTALLKFKLPVIFNKYKKIIYLDGDILVQSDLSDLYSEDVSDYYVAAVHDTGKLYHNKEIYKKIPLYFNSGVILLNLEKCREDNMTEKLIEEKKANTDHSLMDQNVLNIVFSDHVKIIDIKYNFLILNLTRASKMFKFEELNKLFNANYKNLSDIEKQACILHFSSKDKPWKFYDGPYSKEWYNYFIKSPHKDSFLVRSKFVLNEFNSTQRKALIIELNPCHGECIPGYAKYFLDLGYDLRIIMNNVIEADDPLADIFSNKKVEVSYMPQPDIIKFIQDPQQMNQYSVCLFNSNYIYKYQKSVVYLLAQTKYNVKILAVEHRQELIDSKIQAKCNVVVLKKFGKNASIYEVNPHYFGKYKNHDKNPKTEFVVVGNIDSKRKNYALLVNALTDLINSKKTNFHITIVGDGIFDDLPAFAKDYITLTGRLTFIQMYQILSKADFFLPLLDYQDKNHRRYYTTGTSGSFQLIYGFNIPCIIDENFARKYNLTCFDSLPYSRDGFVTALIKAIDMSNDEYKILLHGLSAKTQTVYQESLIQMRDAIEKNYKKEPFPIKPYVFLPYYLIRSIFLRNKIEAISRNRIETLNNAKYGENLMTKKINFLGIPFCYENTSNSTRLKLGIIPLFAREKIISKVPEVPEKAIGKKIEKADKNKIRIAIQFQGGFGDQLLACNYVKALKEKLNDDAIIVDVYCRDFIGELFLQNENFINSFFKESDFNSQDEYYDVSIKLVRFPEILKCNDKKLQKNPTLYKYIVTCRNFKENNKIFFTGRTEFDSILNVYTLIKNQKRCNQMDIDNFLGLDDKFKYVPQIPQTTILEQYNLNNKKFITLHRGVDGSHTKDSNKLWPMEYYNELIALIKRDFPQYTLVQMGINEDRCPPMKGIDVNLVGKTTMEDVAYILKNSSLHIDGEGGMVHIRHAVAGGTSIVLFGPTSIEFYGYSENINLSSNICPHWCEHIKEKWDEGCIKTGGQPLCMAKIMPSDVFKKITSHLKDEV